MFARSFIVCFLLQLWLTLCAAGHKDKSKKETKICPALDDRDQKKCSAGHENSSKRPQDKCKKEEKCPAQFSLREDSNDYNYPGNSSYLDVWNNPMYTQSGILNNISYSSNIGYCITTDTPKNAANNGNTQCSWTFFINEDQNYGAIGPYKKCSGTITSQGPFRNAIKVNHHIVTGGTGAYLAVQGTISYTLINDTNKCLPLTTNLLGYVSTCPDYDVAFNLIYPSNKPNA